MSAYMCEGCGKEAARPTGFGTVTFARITGTVPQLVVKEQWVLCKACGEKVAEMVENALIGGELRAARR